MSTTEVAIPAFDELPELQRLGTAVLQRLTDSWLRTPVAKEHRIEKIIIDERNARPVIVDCTVSLPPSETPSGNASKPFPKAELLLYIIEQGFSSPETRLRLKQFVRLRGEWDARAAKASQPAPKPLYARCKNLGCRKVFRTQYLTPPGEAPPNEVSSSSCPACGEASQFQPTDYFVIDVPEEKPPDIANQQDPDVTWFSIIAHWNMSTFSRIAPLIGRLNNAEFEGHPAETVFFIGPNATSTMPFGRLYFLRRDHSFNQMINPKSGHWEEVRHAATNRTLYELADFSPLALLKLDLVPETEPEPQRGDAYEHSQAVRLCQRNGFHSAAYHSDLRAAWV